MKMKLMKMDNMHSAECDAHTLMEADLIMQDKKRKAAAAKAAAKMAEEKAEKLKALKKVSRKK